MKYLSVFLLALLAMSSCKKEQATDPYGVIPEPPQVTVLSKDTIRAGSYWGLTIGSDAAVVYARLQELRTERGLLFLGLDKNSYANLDSIKNKISLYNTISVPTIGLTFSFYAGKIDRITRGLEYTRWPAGAQGDNSLAIGDDVSAIYQKLANIKMNVEYQDKFVQILMPFKRLDTAYDPNMAGATDWWSTTSNVNGRYNDIYLTFSNGKLISIISVAQKAG